VYRYRPDSSGVPPALGRDGPMAPGVMGSVIGPLALDKETPGGGNPPGVENAVDAPEAARRGSKRVTQSWPEPAGPVRLPARAAATATALRRTRPSVLPGS